MPKIKDIEANHEHGLFPWEAQCAIGELLFRINVLEEVRAAARQFYIAYHTKGEDMPWVAKEFENALDEAFAKAEEKNDV